MPSKPKHPCNHPGCGQLTSERFCSIHKENDTNRGGYDQRRGTSAQRGYNSAWRRYRRSFLLRNPLCVECQREGRLTEATVVDHVVPHRGDRNLFWDPSNHQPMCKPHHDKKTAREDGGFGNKRAIDDDDQR